MPTNRHIELPWDPPENEILRVVVGSQSHGTAIEDNDDLDLMGVFVERADHVVGLKRPVDSIVRRTAGEGARSWSGDVDATWYSLRHFMTLATQGNPSILAALYSTDIELLDEDGGVWMRVIRSRIVSQRAIPRYLGYAAAQLDRLTGGGKRSRVPKRPELIERYGYDTKDASHALRQALQGIELATTGTIQLPMDPSGMPREHVMLVKTGGVSESTAVTMIGAAIDELSNLPGDKIKLRKEPDYVLISRLMRETHLHYWKKDRL